MDAYAQILAAINGLESRLCKAGVDSWLDSHPKVEIEGQPYFVIAGDRLATKAEAMLAFAEERGLVSGKELGDAASSQPLPSGVEAVEVKTPEERSDE